MAQVEGRKYRGASVGAQVEVDSKIWTQLLAVYSILASSAETKSFQTRGQLQLRVNVQHPTDGPEYTTAPPPERMRTRSRSLKMSGRGWWMLSNTATQGLPYTRFSELFKTFSTHFSTSGNFLKLTFSRLSHNPVEVSHFMTQRRYR